jgi:hypothetical protein
MLELFLSRRLSELAMRDHRLGGHGGAQDQGDSDKDVDARNIHNNSRQAEGRTLTPLPDPDLDSPFSHFGEQRQFLNKLSSARQ